MEDEEDICLYARCIESTLYIQREHISISRYLDDEEDISLYARDIFNQYLRSGAKRGVAISEGARTQLLKDITEGTCTAGMRC